MANTKTQTFLSKVFLSRQAISRGASMVEVIAATAIMLFTLTGISSGFLALTLINRQSEDSADAIASAQGVLDTLRLQSIEDLPTGGSQICTPDAGFVCVDIGEVPQQNGSVIVTYCPDVSPTYCTPGDNSIRHIQIDVLGRNADGALESVFTTETVFAGLRDL